MTTESLDPTSFPLREEGFDVFSPNSSLTGLPITGLVRSTNPTQNHRKP